VRRELPPIVKASRRVVSVVEEAVTRFPRRHRYTLGADLRRDAMQVNRCAHRAWRDRSQQLARVRELVVAMDELRFTLQLGKDVNAYGSFREFEMIAELVTNLGRQCGGWLKRLRSTGQNDQAVQPQGQRAPILSSRPASAEASL
jgi:hypothetical protein